ncbi:putative polyol transporter 4 [Tripterygium wilfordii]|uniref:Putative polyol transporter 4 n=1 Tax=Tripterygium wilfordii TaxID=458696 RepID=A0A7J7C1B5_TRIWF|nr:putative polyol transporter 4 [Tripterygium wilfordii]
MQTASFFPGFGAFAAAMDALNSTGFLGICLGLQLLFKSSKENGPGQGKGFDIDLINVFKWSAPKNEIQGPFWGSPLSRGLNLLGIREVFLRQIRSGRALHFGEEGQHVQHESLANIKYCVKSDNSIYLIIAQVMFQESWDKTLLLDHQWLRSIIIKDVEMKGTTRFHSAAMAVGFAKTSFTLIVIFVTGKLGRTSLLYISTVGMNICLFGLILTLSSLGNGKLGTRGWPGNFNSLWQ